MPNSYHIMPKSRSTLRKWVGRYFKKSKDYISPFLERQVAWSDQWYATSSSLYADMGCGLLPAVILSNGGQENSVLHARKGKKNKCDKRPFFVLRTKALKFMRCKLVNALTKRSKNQVLHKEFGAG